MNLFKPLVDIATRIGGKYIENKGKRDEFVAEFSSAALDFVSKSDEARAGIIGAEIKSDRWLASNWRPILMLTIVFIVANNYILAPYINLFFEEGAGLVLDLPDKLWTLMTVGVGGYIPGRSVEKAVKAWKAK